MLTWRGATRLWARTAFQRAMLVRAAVCVGACGAVWGADVACRTQVMGVLRAGRVKQWGVERWAEVAAACAQSERARH